MITEKEILDLKKEAEAGKERLTKARATKEEVERNLKTHYDDLRALGIDPEKRDVEIAAREIEIQELFERAKALLPSNLQQKLI